MDSASEDLYLQKIEEFVYDEDKIVTFRWLSSTLGISASDSKHLLEKYVSDHRVSKPNDLAVTYLLSGMVEENTLGFAIVKEDELEDKKDELINILSQQIYSVQKCKQTDLNAVSLVDYFDMHNPPELPIVGSVISKSCIKRVFKPKKALPPPQQPTIKGKASFFTKPQKSADKVDGKSVDKVDAAKSNPITEVKSTSSFKQNQTKQTAPQKNGIASFFTKGASKTDLKPREKTEQIVKVEGKSEENKAQDVKQAKMETKDRIKRLVDSDSESEDVISPTPNSQKSKENQKPKRSYKRQRKENKKAAPSPKRRKRIVEHNDSDSDDIFGDDKDGSIQEDVIDNSEEDSEPVLKPKPPLAPKNKKRKQVDRTFTDEEGYVITRKEWVEESASEEEAEPVKLPEPEKKKIKEEIKVKNEIKKLNKSDDASGDKVINGKAKGGKGKKGIAPNQKTLMSFFNRK